MKLVYTVQENHKYENVLEVLKCEFMLSDRLIRKLKLSHFILLNDDVVLPSHLLHIGDVIKIKIRFDEDNSNIVPTKMNLEIIYEDDAYIIVNKPSGIPVHPSMDHYTDSLSNGIRYYFDEKGLKRKIRPVNRIDKDTSGIVIFAKNEYIQECLIRQMKSHTFQKEYIAICDGIFEEKKGSISAPIARKEGSIIERCIDSNGDSAITHYEVIDEAVIHSISYSVVKCFLETGRTHQIRVHMKHIGHPLLGDTLYGSSSSLISRQALHAYQVKFMHPLTKKECSYIAPLPEDIKKLIANLRSVPFVTKVSQKGTSLK